LSIKLVKEVSSEVVSAGLSGVSGTRKNIAGGGACIEN
jgi:hypothetical protein